MFCAEGKEKSADVLDNDGTIGGCYGLEVMQMRTATQREGAVWHGVVCRIRRMDNGMLH